MISITALAKNIAALVGVAAIIVIPIVLLLWKRKLKKIKKGIPEDMEDQIKKFRENERRVEELRQDREDETRKTNNLVEEFRKRSRLGKEEQEIDKRRRDSIAGKPIDDSTDKDVSGGGSVEGTGEIQETESDSIGQPEPNSQVDWPSFE